jgi:hypothetical protein
MVSSSSAACTTARRSICCSLRWKRTPLSAITSSIAPTRKAPRRASRYLQAGRRSLLPAVAQSTGRRDQGRRAQILRRRRRALCQQALRAEGHCGGIASSTPDDLRIVSRGRRVTTRESSSLLPRSARRRSPSSASCRRRSASPAFPATWFRRTRQPPNRGCVR